MRSTAYRAKKVVREVRNTYKALFCISVMERRGESFPPNGFSSTVAWNEAGQRQWTVSFLKNIRELNRKVHTASK